MRVRLYPTTEQESALVEWCGQSRFIENLAVEQQKHYVKHGASSPPTSAERYKQLAQLRAEIPWLAAGPSHIQQQALRVFDQSMRNFFKAPSHFGPPVFRSRHRMSLGVSDIRDGGIQVFSKRSGSVLVPKTGHIRMRFSKNADLSAVQESRSFRVRRDPLGRWFASFVLPEEVRVRPLEVPEQRQRQGPIGIDVGVTTTIVDSNGQHYRAPRSKKKEKRIDGLKSAASKAPRGSAKRRRLHRKAYALEHTKTLRRRDWQNKITTRFVQNHTHIVIEDLKIENMRKRAKPKPGDPGKDEPDFLPNGAAAKTGLNRVISASGWGRLFQLLESKAARATRPSQVVRVPPQHTSQKCSHCGHTEPANRNGKVFHCTECGSHMDADHNAALNILARGTSLRQSEDIGRTPSGHATFEELQDAA